jgi:hypothetical protein
MSKRQKVSQERRNIMAQWKSYPALSAMYDDPEQYREALGRIESKAEREDETEDIKKFGGKK